ncbi:MAG: DUF2948 family protein [Rhizobiaceae bacterium]|nr:DUF2948 family protein [Rhizobiaceae bacterium]
MSNLKLMALDAEDLEVISSCCQDSVLKIGEMTYLPREKRFVLTVNRFAWEKNGEKERRRSVLHFERVQSVKVSGLDRNDPDMVTSLLAILFEAGESPSGTIELVFAGDGAIRLDVECVEAQLADMPAAWEAQSVPNHD